MIANLAEIAAAFWPLIVIIVTFSALAGICDLIEGLVGKRGKK